MDGNYPVSFIARESDQDSDNTISRKKRKQQSCSRARAHNSQKNN